MAYDDSAAMRHSNKASIWAYGIMNLILVVSYLIEVLKHSRTIGYYAVFCVLAVVPFLMCLFLYRRNRAEAKLRYVMSVGFVIFYLFIIFTTISPIAYVYAFMIAIILVSYNDTKLCGIYMGTICAGNIVQVAYAAAAGQIASEDMPNVEIRLASVFLFTAYQILSTSVARKINGAKIKQVEEEKENTGRVMNEILQVSERMTQNIVMVSKKMMMLEETAGKTKVSMENVAEGTNDTVQSIQVQQEKTQDIQRTIEQVETASGSITDNVMDTKKELDASKENLDELIKCANISNEANASVSKELSQLSEYTNQMQSIIEMIDSITSQTSLLSLNASIEAARAGDAGRGFAVVASEISNLADQTQKATEDITSLIGNISNELEDVVKVIEDMIGNAQQQNHAAANTVKNFEQIERKTDRVYSEAGKMEELVHELNDANQAIVDGIATISAATEEVTAHSLETLEVSEKNSTITEEVGAAVGSLQQLAEQLKAMEA